LLKGGLSGNQLPLFMNKSYVVLAIAGLVLSAGCRKKPAAEIHPAPPPAKVPVVLARFHFAGAEQLGQNTNATQLRAVWKLPQTAEFRESILEKLAGAIAARFAASTNPTDSAQASLIRPLLADLFQAESILELSQLTNEPPVLSLAVRLEEERANIWRTNWFALMGRWSGNQPAAVKVENFSAWAARGTRSPQVFTLIEAGRWLVLGMGQNQVPAPKSLLRRLSSGGETGAGSSPDWIAGEMNLLWLVKALRLPEWAQGPPGQWPERLDLKIAGRGENLRTTLRIIYPAPLRLAFEPWLIPTNAIHDDQLISFTASQSLAPWLSQVGWMKKLGLEAPNQFYLWSLGEVPFLTLAATPVKEATNVLERVAERLPNFLTNQMQLHMAGKLTWETNRTGLMWRGWPILIPYVRPAQEPGSQFLLGGIFPIASSTNPPPPELLAQLTTRTNLVYYDWEITQARLTQWLNLGPLLELILRDMLMAAEPNPLEPPSVRGRQWLTAVATNLGETVTEVTLTSPRELTLVRKSHLGLTGVELMALVRWLENPAFPGLPREFATAARESSDQRRNKP
jgi:hypothetical protein